jgi:hypothetical protein
MIARYLGEMPEGYRREMHLFGNYRARSHEEEAATIRTIGSTMYISLKELTRRNGINEIYPMATMTLTLPQDIPYELRGQNNTEIKEEQ